MSESSHGSPYLESCYDYWKICWDSLSEKDQVDLRVMAEFSIGVQGHSRLRVENLLSSKISSPYLPEAIKCYHMLSDAGKAHVMDKIRRYSGVFSNTEK